MQIGRHTYGAPHVHWWGEDVELRIGAFCSIALGVSFILGGNHRTDWVTTYPFTEFADWPEAHTTPGHPASKGSIIIGNDVWLGSAATVLSGVSVADGAVVAAGAVVTKDVPPYAVVAGNPGRVVAHRFEPDVIDGLLRMQWWNWSDRKIQRRMKGLLSDDVERFVRRNAPAVDHTADNREA
nr:CatB-related O-acetyltransferase [Nocardioides flavescens]